MQNSHEAAGMQIEVINNNNILKAWYRNLHDKQVCTVLPAKSESDVMFCLRGSVKNN